MAQEQGFCEQEIGTLFLKCDKWPNCDKDSVEKLWDCSSIKYELIILDVNERTRSLYIENTFCDSSSPSRVE